MTGISARSKNTRNTVWTCFIIIINFKWDANIYCQASVRERECGKWVEPKGTKYVATSVSFQIDMEGISKVYYLFGGQEVIHIWSLSMNRVKKQHFHLKWWFVSYRGDTDSMGIRNT